MMKEIRARGPMPGNITVPWTFSMYRNGVYSHSGLVKNAKSNPSKVSMFSKNINWSKVDHSILIVGWGEEDGIKYWICMNSWGPGWGENGFFRIQRGENECSIETMGDAIRIKVEDRN